MKPICVPCQRFYRAKKNGFYFLEGLPNQVVGSDGERRTAFPGHAEPELWRPYKLWSGDLWECPGCGHTLVSGVGHSHVAEHYQPDFVAVVARLGADQFQVNDCC